MLQSKMKGTRQAGFTLLELMFTIVVAAVLLAVGIPNFRDFIRSSRMSAATNDLLTDFNLARSESVKRRVPVTICKSQNGTACDADSTGPFRRWIVFVDDANSATTSANDGNGTVDAGEAVLRDRQIPTTISVTSDGRKLVFLPSGFTNPAIAGSVTQIRLCDSRGNVASAGEPSAARAITLSATGRPSSTREKELIEDLGGC